MRRKKAEQKSTWKMAPFLRLFIPLTAGVIIESNFPLPAGFLILVFCLSLLLIIFCNASSFSTFFRWEWIPGFAIQIAFFSLGRILLFEHQDVQVEHSPCFEKNRSNCLLLQVLSDPVPKQNSLKCLAKVSWLYKDKACYHENEKILVYFNKKLDTRQFSSGSLIIIRKELRPIENMKASGFDYRKYCALKHIYAQVFLKENEFALIHHDNEKSPFSLLDSLRKKLLIIIKNQIPRKSENGLLEALMVGFTDDLDPGLLKSYADTGVIHIIAISGLHLALICHILQLTFKRVGRTKSGIWLKFILIVTSLWCYSLLSGASPSVIRAAAMFSMVLFARNILRETVLYNTLAASAFLLLCFDPYWIWDTGFQLSYAAVLGLRLFSKPVRDLLPLQNKILAAVWDAASISIAAQVLTTPVSIYYFHRFPVYFLVANLLAVPLSSAILLGGILLCIFSWIPLAGQSIGWLLVLMIRLLNGFIRQVSQLPGAVVPELVLTLPQLILVYFIIFCFYRFLLGKAKSWLLTGLSAICLFQFLRLFL
jgi:competence protein ComEC